MSRQSLLYIPIFLTIGLGGIIGLGQFRADRRLTQPDSVSAGIIQQKNTGQRPRCWDARDPTVTTEDIQKRQELQIRGYSQEITLDEAVRAFNQEKQCDDTLAPYPLLTEEEVLAAIVAGPGFSGAKGERWIGQQTVLYKIVREKKMPKGSLLVATGGPNVSGSILRPDGSVKAKGIDIAMLIGLANRESGQELKPEQILEIRRTYFSFESVK